MRRNRRKKKWETWIKICKWTME